MPAETRPHSPSPSPYNGAFAPAPEVAFTLVEAWSQEELIARLSGRFSVQRGAAHELREVFVDTHDWRLLQARMTLAHSIRGPRGKASELQLHDGGGSVERARVRKLAAFAWELPEGPLRQAIASHTAVRRLLPQADTEVEITPLEVIDEREKIVVRIHIRTGRVRGPGLHSEPTPAQPLPITVSVEPLRGYGAERDAVVEFLAGDPALVRTRESALSQALGALGRDPGSERLPWRVELKGKTPAGVEVRRTLARFVEIMRANEAGILADLDTEYLHDFRVAVRRTRSILSQCKQVLAPDELKHFKGEFSWLGKCTSPVRDLDVFLLAAHGRAGNLGGADPEQLEPVRRLLARKRRTAAKHLFDVLRSSRYHYALESWSAFLEVPTSADPEGSAQPTADFASERIRRQHGRILKRVRKLKPSSPAEQVHGLRIECKKLRYLVDAFGGLFPLQAGARMVKHLKRLQSVLGDYNDAEVQANMLLALADELGQPARKTSPLLIVELGRAVERLSQQSAQLRPKVHKRMRQFAAEQSADALDELLGPQPLGGDSNQESSNP